MQVSLLAQGYRLAGEIYKNKEVELTGVSVTASDMYSVREGV